MADIGLRPYLHQIDGLIEHKQLDEAVTHCKHILTHYPKSLETYRLLGKALLEKGRHGDAADIFQRVLSAAPDDFVAHVGMSLVREDEANLEAALWHMERAFESNPANTAIQEELRRLYGRRDGVMPARARLTRGALARMYVAGELYPQAEAELKAALDDDPERLDLLVLLARVQLETGRRAEAAETLNQVMHKLPYSQEGNRLLAALLTAQNRPEDVKVCRQRLEALDPYEAYADGHTSVEVPDDAVQVPEPPPIGEAGAAAGPAAPDWAVSLGETTPFGLPAEAETGEDPEWLKTGTGMLTAQPAALTGGADFPAAGELPDWMRDVEPTQSGAAPELPDWMKATTGMLSETPAEPGETPRRKGTGSLSGWIKPADETPAEAPAEADLPDWMKDMAPPAAAAAETTAWLTPDESARPAWLPDETEPSALSGEPAQAPLGDLPDWMKLSEPLDSLPEWMRAPAQPAATAPAQPAGTAQLSDLADTPAEELPDWLKAASRPAASRPAASRPAASEPAASEPAASPTAAVDLPDFLQPASAESIERANTPVDWDMEAPAAEPEPAAADGVPDWIKAMAPAAGIAAALPVEEELPPIDAAELPEWLKSAPAGPTEVTEAISPAAQPAEAVPDWLKALGEAPDLPAEAAAPADDLPDWLKAASGSVVAAPEISAEAAAPADDLPDWLKAASGSVVAAPEISAEAAAPADDLPDWLKAAAAPEQPTAGSGPEATRAPDWLPEPAALDETPAGLADDLPAWARVGEPEAPESAPAWPADKPSPEWLKKPGEAPTAPAADWLRQPTEPPAIPVGEPALPDWLQPTTAAPAAPAEAEVPDLSSMDPDEAMRWLMSLAERQGAAPEELAAVRADLDAAAAPAAPAPTAEAVSEAELAALTASLHGDDDELPEWLRESPTAPAPAVAEALPPAPAEDEVPDLSNMDPDEAMRWLMSLAERQGAAPEELAAVRADLDAAPAGPVMPGLPIEEPPAEPTAAADLPDWLKELQAETPAAPAPAPAVAEALPPAPAEAEVPDLSNMDPDEAMRWLMSLAERQGAAPEELAAVRADLDAAPAPKPAEEPVAEPTAADELPDWLKEFQAAETPAPAPVQPAPAVEDLNTTTVPDWIAGYGAPVAATPAWAAPAAPEPEPEPVEEPAPEPVSGLPDWIKAAAGPETTGPAAGAPEWVKAETPPIPAAPIPSATPPTPEPAKPEGNERLTRLAERLAASRRSKDQEVAERLERQRAEREAAQREVAQKMEERRTRQTPGTGPLKPGTGPLRPGTGPLKPGTGPLQPPVSAQPPTDVQPPVEPAPQREARPEPPAIRTPTRLTRGRKTRSGKSPYAGQAPADLLLLSRRRLADGDFTGAADSLGHLIHGGHFLPEVIAALESATFNHPTATVLFRVLGDAYMKDNQLQKALEAYREALARL